MCLSYSQAHICKASYSWITDFQDWVADQPQIQKTKVTDFLFFYIYMSNKNVNSSQMMKTKHDSSEENGFEYEAFFFLKDCKLFQAHVNVSHISIPVFSKS